MEMPEGWKKFNSSYKLGSGIPIDVSCDKQEEAAQLLQEMAEALEELEKGGHVSYWNLPGSKPRIVLNKFKEWK